MPTAPNNSVLPVFVWKSSKNLQNVLAAVHCPQIPVPCRFRRKALRFRWTGLVGPVLDPQRRLIRTVESIHELYAAAGIIGSQSALEKLMTRACDWCSRSGCVFVCDNLAFQGVFTPATM